MFQKIIISSCQLAGLPRGAGAGAGAGEPAARVARRATRGRATNPALMLTVWRKDVC